METSLTQPALRTPSWSLKLWLLVLLSEMSPSSQPATQQARVPCHRASFHVALTGPCWPYQPGAGAGGAVEPRPLWLPLQLSDEVGGDRPVAAQCCSVHAAHTWTLHLLQLVILD